MNLEELKETLGGARATAKLVTKAVDQIAQSAKALDAMDEDALATDGGREGGRISQAARDLQEQTGALGDFAARVLAQGGPATHGWESSLEQVTVSLRQERGRLMIMGRGLTREEEARMEAFGAAEQHVAQAIEALHRGVPSARTAGVARALAAPAEAPGGEDQRRQLAARILGNDRIKLATAHVSGVNDDATARENIRDTSEGRPASRSDYGNAPGGTVVLDLRLLGGILALAERYTMGVSEIAGASHSPNSRHYVGVAVDVSVINGSHVNASHPDVDAFMAKCRELGATEMRGPGDAGHATHVHAAWPRP